MKTPQNYRLRVRKDGTELFINLGDLVDLLDGAAAIVEGNVADPSETILGIRTYIMGIAAEALDIIFDD